MSTRKDAKAAMEKAAKVEAAKAKGELRRAAGAALKRAGLPKDLIERTKTLPGAPFEHREAFTKLLDTDRLTLRKAFKDFADFPHGEFDKLTGAGDGENGRPTPRSRGSAPPGYRGGRRRERAPDTSRPVARHRR